MSMLAGPRRKQKVINLRAKNNAWSNDSNKFGQRMLEKMGWSSGKGLGAREHGIVEHVVAKFKNDDRGLGFEDKNDQWTQHEDDFNALLANLSNASAKEVKLHSGVSLEDKSKKSKARIHYHKFTRGKDISRYSEKELANIFGKRSFKNENNEEDSQNDEETSSERVFTDKGSMEDYFKNKLAAFKLKNNITPLESNKNSSQDADCEFRGFATADNESETENSQQGFGVQTFSFYGTTGCKSVEINYVSSDNENTEKKKKNKKKKVLKKSDTELNVESMKDKTKDESENFKQYVKKKQSKKTDSEEEVSKEDLTSKKKKKKMLDIPEPQEHQDSRLNIQELLQEEYVLLKKKSKKRPVLETAGDTQDVDSQQDINAPKKKKKRKHKDIKS